jgi:hypothetical protein
MTWFKVDDDLPQSVKFDALCEGPCRAEAIALWLYAGCSSSKCLKDGFVPTGTVIKFGFHAEAASELVRVGLWYTIEGGYKFHDWADYQPSSARVEQRRKAAADRKAKTRAKLSSAKNTMPMDVSRRDIVRDKRVTEHPVTLSPLIESQPCRASAARDRERENSSSGSDLRSEIASAAPTAPEPPAPNTEPSAEVPLQAVQLGSSKAANAGYRWFATIWEGRSEFDAPPLESFRRQFEYFGTRSPNERAKVADSIRKTIWCSENKHHCHPGHVEKFWHTYLAGPNNRKGQVSAGPVPCREVDPTLQDKRSEARPPIADRLLGVPAASGGQR